MSYKSNRKQLNSQIQQAFHRTCDRFGDALDNAIEADIYEWDRITHRTSGEIVGSPRNVRDTGYLQDSRYDVSKVNSRDYIYPADYAMEALESHLTSDGDNWVDVAVESEDWAGVYREEWRKKATF